MLDHSPVPCYTHICSESGREQRFHPISKFAQCIRKPELIHILNPVPCFIVRHSFCYSHQGDKRQQSHASSCSPLLLSLRYSFCFSDQWMRSSAGHKAPQIKEKTERNRDYLLQVTFCREKKRAGGEENQTLKAKTHNPTFSYSESRTIHAWIRMRRAYIVYRTMPVISTQRYCRIEFCKI